MELLSSPGRVPWSFRRPFTFILYGLLCKTAPSGRAASRGVVTPPRATTLSAELRRVRAGESITVLDCTTPVALLTPVPAAVRTTHGPAEHLWNIEKARGIRTSEEGSNSHPHSVSVRGGRRCRAGGVEQVAQRVAEHVDAVHHDGQAQARPDRQPRRHLHVLAAFPAQHPAPARHPGRQAEPQKAQGRLRPSPSRRSGSASAGWPARTHGAGIAASPGCAAARRRR